MLVNAGLMIPVEYTDFSVKGYGMVLKTKCATWKIPGHTFTFRTLKTVVLNWITINELLLKYNLGLIDAHLGNFTLTGRCEPKWLDLGSIQPLCRGHYGISGLLECLFYPLLVFECKPHLDRAVRLLMKDGGISRKELFDLAGWHLFRFPQVCGAFVAIFLMLKVSKYCDMEASLKRRWILRLLRFAIESLSLKLPERSRPDHRPAPTAERTMCRPRPSRMRISKWTCMAPWIDSTSARGTKLLEAFSEEGGHTCRPASDLFSAHDHAEGEFFSVAAGNPGQRGQTTETGPAGQRSPPCQHRPATENR